MYKHLESFLKTNHIKYSVMTDSLITVFGIKTDVANFQCIADVKEEQNIFVFYVIIGLIVAPEKRLLLAELITKINFGLVIGNFEMDFEDGEIRYKASMDYNGGELLEKHIENIINTSISTVNTYFNPIVKTLTNGVIQIEN